ncbi:MAG: serine hydrolase, partial [Myxococcales bacterium]|nr:serine hydrolase [Myxococcales bacterium]
GLTIRSILAHASGLPAWLPLGHRLWEQHPDTVPGSHEAKRLIRGWIQSEVAKLPIQNTATTPTYSDIGYIVLGWWFESRFKQSLDELIKSRVLTPWHLTSTRFVGTNEWTSGDSPLANFSAATELCPIRKRVIVGQVHDENAFALGGVCGHAGLFSTADDVGKWADHLLNSYYGFGPVKQETVKLFWTTGGRFSQNDTRGHFGNKISPADLGTWRLGWDTPSVTGSSGGNNIPRDAVGHLGFTGCSVWIVPSLCATVVLLSNRVHPTRNNDAIKTFRPALHNLIWDIVRQTTPQQNKFSSS